MRLAEQPQNEVNHEEFFASRLEKPKKLHRMKKEQHCRFPHCSNAIGQPR
jgi:hypothetical protein